MDGFPFRWRGMSKSVQKHRIVHIAFAGGYASSIGGYRVLRKWALGLEVQDVRKDVRTIFQH